MGLAWWEKALLVGLPALMAVVFVGLVSGVARKRPPDRAAEVPTSSSGSTEPKAGSPAQTSTAPSVDEAVAFIQSSSRPFKDAQHACNWASGCSVVAPDQPETGAVRTVADIAPCVRARLPVCERLAKALEDRPAPSLIHEAWQGVLDMHIRGSRDHARVLVDMTAPGRRVRLPKSGYGRPNVFDELPDGDHFKRRLLSASLLSMEGNRGWDALSAWLKKYGACEGAELPNACGLASLLHDDPRKVGARFAANVETRWYIGGTLHRADVTEWSMGTRENKLATAADWAMALPGVAKAVQDSGDINNAQHFAKELIECVDKVSAARGLSPNAQTSGLVAGCAILMGWR